MKYLLLIAILILASSLGAFADSEIVSISGIAVIPDAGVYLDSPEGTRYHLLLAPKTLLDSLGISIDKERKYSNRPPESKQILVTS
jgi:hypothetical protein